MNDMKRTIKAVALLLLITILLSLASCAQKETAVLSFEGRGFPVSQFAFTLAESKSEVVDYHNYYGGVQINICSITTRFCLSPINSAVITSLR